MSDHDHHDPGGHELEAVNTKLLFRLLLVCGAITLLASFAVVQWFNAQKREMQRAHAAEGSFQLQAYKTEMATNLEGVDKVAADIVANPSLLKAPEAPANWTHPDDLVGGGAAPAAAPAGEHEEPAIPVKAPEGDTPAEGDDAAPTEGDDAAPAEGEGDAEGDADAPAEEPKPAEKPKPAEGGDKAPEGGEGKGPQGNQGKGPQGNQGKSGEGNQGKGGGNQPADDADQG